MKICNKTKQTAPIISAEIYNAHKMADGEQVSYPIAFPATTQEVQYALYKIGIDGVLATEYFFDNQGASVRGLYKALPFCVDIDELNYLAVLIGNLSAEDCTKLEAVIEHYAYSSHELNNLYDIINVVKNLSNYTLIPVFSEAEYGAFLLANERSEVSDALLELDLAEEYGVSKIVENDSVFTSAGLLTECKNPEQYHYNGVTDIPQEFRVFAYPEPDAEI